MFLTMFMYDPQVDGLTTHTMAVTPQERWFLQCMRAGDGKALSDAISTASEIAAALSRLPKDWLAMHQQLDMASFILDDISDDTVPLREAYLKQLPDPDRPAYEQVHQPDLTWNEAWGIHPRKR